MIPYQLLKFGSKIEIKSTIRAVIFGFSEEKSPNSSGQKNSGVKRDCTCARTSARGLLSLTNAVWRFESGLFKGFTSEYKRQEQQASENNHRIKFFSGEMVNEKATVAARYCYKNEAKCCRSSQCW